MDFDRFVWNMAGAAYYATLIAWEYIKMGVAWVLKKIKMVVLSGNKHHQSNKKSILV